MLSDFFIIKIKVYNLLDKGSTVGITLFTDTDTFWDLQSQL